MYVYIKTKGEDCMWTVGFYRPDGRWEPESDHDTRQSAAERVHYLNGEEKQEGEMNEVQRVYIQAKARHQAAQEAMGPYDDKAMRAFDDDETAFDRAAEITAEGMRATGYNEALDAKVAAREALLEWVEAELKDDPRWSGIAPLFEIKAAFWREKAADVAAKLRLEGDNGTYH